MVSSTAQGDSARPIWLRKPERAQAGPAPFLRAIMERTAETWSGAFATLAGSPDCEVTFTRFDTGRVADVQVRRDARTVFAVLDAPGWACGIGLAFQPALLPFVIDILFGGSGEDEADAAERPPTPMMMQLAEVLARQAAGALDASVAAGGIGFGRFLTKLDFSFLGKPGGGVTAATFELQANGRKVSCDVLIPQAVIDALAGSHAGRVEAEQPDVDQRWARQLETEITRASVRVTAAMEMSSLSLGAIATLQPGQVLALPTGAGSRVTLRCGPEDLFRCDLGQSDGFYTIRVRDALLREATADTLSPPLADL